MNKIILLLSGFIFLSLSILAQNDKDFILTMSKDTLYGKIKFDPKKNVITFYYQRDKVTFHAATINTFGTCRDGVTRTYKSITNDWKEEVFVEVLTEGRLNLYRYNTSGNKLYEKEETYAYRYYIGEAGEGLRRMSPMSYRNTLKVYIKGRTISLGERLQFEDVPNLVQAYNQKTSLTAARKVIKGIKGRKAL